MGCPPHARAAYESTANAPTAPRNISPPWAGARGEMSPLFPRVASFRCHGAARGRGRMAARGMRGAAGGDGYLYGGSLEQSASLLAAFHKMNATDMWCHMDWADYLRDERPNIGNLPKRPKT